MASTAVFWRRSVEGPVAPGLGGECEGQDESVERCSEVGLTEGGGGGGALAQFRRGGGFPPTVLRQEAKGSRELSPRKPRHRENGTGVATDGF
jgi:hypothetical protein